jgi:hypothetical protein
VALLTKPARYKPFSASWTSEWRITTQSRTEKSLPSAEQPNSIIAQNETIVRVLAATSSPAVAVSRLRDDRRF